MAEFTPTTEEMRRHYAFTMAGDHIHRTEQYAAEFDRWLAARDAQVKSEALLDAADRARRDLASEVGGHTSTYSVRRWLCDLADAQGQDR